MTSMDVHHLPERWEASFWHCLWLHSAGPEATEAGDRRRKYEWKKSIPMFSICLQPLPPPPVRPFAISHGRPSQHQLFSKDRRVPHTHSVGTDRKAWVVLLGLTRQPLLSPLPQPDLDTCALQSSIPSLQLFLSLCTGCRV